MIELKSVEGVWIFNLFLYILKTVSITFENYIW